MYVTLSMCLRHHNTLKFVQLWAYNQNLKPMGISSCCRDFGSADAHSCIHELTERYRTAGSCCTLPRFCLVWIILHALIIPCFPRHSWGLGAARLAWPGRAGKALVWSGETEPSWFTLLAKPCPDIMKPSGHPGMTDYPLEDSITHCL